MPHSNDEKNLTIEILRRIGTPAGPAQADENNVELPGPVVLEEEFDWAWENRIGLLYLLSLPEPALSDRLLARRAELLQREKDTYAVVRRVSGVLDELGIPYVIFKTVRPFPFTPNDTDVLFLTDRKEYKKAVTLLAEKGYKQLGVAPLQILAYDPEGEGKVGLKKEGGVYYLDLYEKAGADYFSYLDTRRAAKQIMYVDVDGAQIPVLRPELELAVMLFHNVFPENTYHIEHFYLVMHYLYGAQPVDIGLFADQVKQNHFSAAVRANLTVTRALHQEAFGFVPDLLDKALLAVGGNDKTVEHRLQQAAFLTPYYFRPLLFIGAAIAKLAEWNSFSSLVVQALHMLSPAFLKSAVIALANRIKGAGVYEQV